MIDFFTKIFIKNSSDVKNPNVRKAYGTFSSIVGIGANIVLAAVKIFLGAITASAAVVADALNNFSDAGSSIISLVSFRLSAKPADREHPFGHARLEYIASMIVSFLILLVGFETLIDSAAVLFGFSEPKDTKFSTVSIVILGISILFKLLLAAFYNSIAKKIGSNVIKASAVDSLTDCISTTAVFVSAIVIKFASNMQIFDTIVSMAVAVMIIIAGIKILIETKNSLLGEAAVDEEIEALNKIVAEYPEILGTHDLMLHNYGPHHFIASFHAEVDGSKDIFMLHDMIDNAEKRIHQDLGILCTIHMDPIVTDDDTVTELKKFLIAVIAEEISEKLSVHDFRVVVGNTHTNMIFDIVLPFESKYSVKEITEKISDAVSKRRSDCYCVITVDRG